jgi:diguanylate cyclase (GGDEF)-like protein
MNQLLSALARLSALRERHALEDALVELVQREVLQHSHWTRLVRAIGEPGQQHWQIRAHFDSQLDTSERDQVWSEWDTLPALSAHPLRQQAIASGQTLHRGDAPCLAVFPVDRDAMAACVLEVQTDERMRATTVRTIEYVLQIYRNLVGLLDYGEKDALTGLLNRKSFDGAFVRAAMQQDALEQEDEHPNRRTPRTQQAYWMAVLDIDHFKRINDTYGHLIGDEVLVLMARIMRTALRLQDQVYRFGGEEFVLMLRCPDHASAEQVLQRFHETVAHFVFPQVGQVTVSIGFTQLRGDDTPDLAFNRADKAVYQAKASGRNRICSFATLVASGTIAETPAADNDIQFF